MIVSNEFGRKNKLTLKGTNHRITRNKSEPILPNINPVTKSLVMDCEGSKLIEFIENGFMLKILRQKYIAHYVFCALLKMCFSIAQFMGFLKGKSSLMIFDRHANLKYKYGSRHFWCRGYYVDTVGRNKKAIEEYIKNQLQEDIIEDQITLKEYIDPFTGSKNSKA